MAGRAINQIGFENKSISTSAAALTGVSGKTSAHVLIHVGSNPIRWRADGTNPTSTVGEYVAAGAYIDWTDPAGDYRSMITKFRAIRDTTASGDATLGVTYMD